MVGGDGGCRVGEVRAGTTSPMPDHMGFKLQQLVNFQKFSTLRVNSAGYNISRADSLLPQGHLVMFQSDTLQGQSDFV